MSINVGLDFLSALGLPQILLWILTFAIVFEILTVSKMFNRAPAAIIAIIVGFLVLLNVPSALIGTISTMSTGLVVLAIAAVVVMALMEMMQIKVGEDKKVTEHYGKWVAIIALILAAVLFIFAGGPALIGIGSIPSISLGTWFLIIIVIIVLWMINESPKTK